MPEGPSIVILKEAVKQFKGRQVINATCNNNSLDPGRLIGQTIIDFKSWGKHFLICFPEFTVRIHLMMFGSYKINSHNARPARLHLQFAGDELNFYSCLLLLIEEPLDEVYDWSADVMSAEWNAKKAIKKMKEQPDLLACDALMDQHIFSGVGNIIKNEVLFRTKIHPLSLVNSLPPKKMRELLDEAVNYSFDFLNWQKAYVLKKHWLAYHKKICPRDGAAFHKSDTGKSRRASFYCEICQKIYV